MEKNASGECEFISPLESFPAVQINSQPILGLTKLDVDKEGGRKALAELPREGFVRLNSIIAPRGPIPVGRSTWWQGVRDGRFPKPVKIGPMTTVWRVEDIRDLIDRLGR